MDDELQAKQIIIFDFKTTMKKKHIRRTIYNTGWNKPEKNTFECIQQ